MIRRLLTMILCTVSLTGTLCGCDLVMDPAKRVARAEAALQAHDYGAASIDLKKVLQRDPANARARLLLAEVELAQGDISAASAEFDKVVSGQVPAVDYDRVEWRLRLAQRRFADVLKGLAEPRPGLPEAQRLLFLARANLGLGDLRGGQDLLRRVVALEPANDEAIAALGATLASTEGLPSALTFLRQAAHDHPGSVEIQRTLADCLMRAGDAAGAEPAYRAALALLSVKTNLRGYLEVSGGLVRALLAQNKLDAAKAVADDLVRAAPNSALTLNLLGQIAAARHDYPTAIEQFQKILNGYPENAEIRTRLAAVQIDAANFEQATANLQRVLAASPDFLPARRLLAQVYLMRGRAQDAIKLLEDRDPSSEPSDLRLLLARAYLATGQKGRAIDILRQVESQSGLTDRTRLDIAAAYLQAGTPEKALALVGGSEGAPSARRDQLALIALSAKDRPAGIKALRDYARTHSDDGAAIQFAGLSLSALGEVAPAVELLTGYLKDHPTDVETLRKLAEVQARAGQMDDAEATLRRAQQVRPTTEARLSLAQIAAARGREDEALRWLEEARAADARATAPRVLLARAYLGASRVVDAQKVVDELVALDPANPDYQLLLAAAAVARRDDPKAVAAVDAAVRLAPESSAAWFSKGQLQARLGQAEGARASLRRAIALAPRAAAPLAALARLELTAGKPAAALAVARDAQSKPESRAIGLALEGDLAMQQRNWTDAARAYERLQSAEPSSRAVLSLYQARVQAAEPSPERALVDWLKQHPADVVVRVALAEHWERAGQRTHAIAEYETALKTSPESAPLLNNLAWLYAQNGDPRALPTSRHAYAREPHNPAVADTLGWILFGLNQRDEGLKLLREAAAGAPAAFDIQYHLATALVAVGDKAGAHAVCARIEAAKTPGDWGKKCAALEAGRPAEAAR